MSETTSTFPVIDMRGVTVGALRDPGSIVASDVNWRVERGEFWAVAGLHGAGKSDLLMLLGGVMGPVQGSYVFLGEEMPIFSEERLSHRLKLGLVFDSGRLFNQMTVAENVALPLRYHHNLPVAGAQQSVNTLLELTGLVHCAHVVAGTLGRNWQRRVALARALALRPEVLLLDMPLAGMDSRQRHWWESFLDQLSRGHAFYEGRPVTLVVTTGNLGDWRGHARQFALLDSRRFITLGGWADVEKSAHPLVRELAAADGVPGQPKPAPDH